MWKIYKFAVLLSLGLGCASVAAQDAPPPALKSRPRSPFQLLSGYKIEIRGGIEGEVGGRVWKPGGLAIDWSDDVHSGGAITDEIQQNDVLWRLELRPGATILVRTRHDRVALSIGTRINFSATIHNDQELAEMLLMCLTYDFQKGFEVPPDSIITIPYR
jgi:hypothetical protein